VLLITGVIEPRRKVKFLERKIEELDRKKKEMSKIRITSEVGVWKT